MSAMPSQEEKDLSFAVCIKIIYGKADMDLFIEWMEYYRLVLNKTKQYVRRHNDMISRVSYNQ